MRALFDGLNPTSAIEHLAFYQLYPATQEGKRALEKAKSLLAGNPDLDPLNISLDSKTIESILCLINKEPSLENRKLSKMELSSIDFFSKRLANRRLKGHLCLDEQEVLKLPSEEIDLARGLLLSQRKDEICLDDLYHYEGVIDLMALHILAKLPPNATPRTKIRAINTFLFEEMRFRFPPRSKYSKGIDIYTALPSVLDSRQGVCLGVSILYLSLAQRLDLKLEIVTPPGHIYMRYKNCEEEINIETTARGIDLPSEEYFSLETDKLQMRTMKEVIGLQHVNNASPWLQAANYEKALEGYKKALEYLPNDPDILELKGMCHLLLGQSEQANLLFSKLSSNSQKKPKNESAPFEDYLAGFADPEAIGTLFFEMEDMRKYLLERKELLEKSLIRCPKFREGWKALGLIWLRLYRPKEAIQALSRYHELDPNSITVEYYLAELYKSRLDYANCQKHLLIAEDLAKRNNYMPKALKDLRKELSLQRF